MTYSFDRSEARSTWAERLLTRGGALVAAGLLLSAAGGWTERARAADEQAPVDTVSVARHLLLPDADIEAIRREAAEAKEKLVRAEAVMKYSTRYQIPADLSAAIYDAARAEGIEPAIAFRLVRVESNFKADARSSADAFGYTQLQLATARFYEPGITEAELYDRETNLRVGFRFLGDLLEKFDNNMHLALLAYNRGPAKVQRILAAGGDPRNGYATAVIKGGPVVRPVPAEVQAQAN